MLADLLQYKILLGVPMSDVSKDVSLTQDLAFADGTIKRFLKRPYLEATAITEYLSGNGKPELVLRHYPVQKVEGVWVDPVGYGGQGPNPFGPATLYRQGIDWALTVDQADGTSQAGTLLRLTGGVLGPAADSTFWGGYGRGSLTMQMPPAWPGGMQNIKVQYTAGYLPLAVPPELKIACAELAAYFRRVKKLGGVPLQSEHLDDYSYTLGTQLLTKFPELGTIRAALLPFRAFSV
jgi:hypothetical protein